MIKKISSLLLLALLVLLCAAGCQKNDTASGEKEGKDSTAAGSGVISADSGSERSEADKFAESILNNAYSEAIAVYNSEIKGNAGLEQEAADYMASYLGEIKSDVLSGACSESDAKAKMTTVKNVCSKTGCDIEDYETLVGAVDQAISSKTAYKSGIALLEQKNYKDAFAELKKVLPDDSDYADANEKYFAAVESYKKEVKSSADTLISGGDYLAALDAYKQAVEILPEDSDLLAGMNTCEKGYISDAVSRAASVFSDYTKYEEALKIIQAALQYYPNDSALIEAREKYKLYAPVNLYDMTEVKGEADRRATDTDTYKQEYTKCFRSVYLSDGITFDLKGTYNIFSATVYGRSTDAEASLYKIIIYGDGRKLYENLSIIDNGRAFDISVDVTGVSDLTLVMDHQKGDRYGGIGLSNMILQRTAK